MFFSCTGISYYKTAIKFQILSISCSYLTNCLQSVDRFPISFRSTFHGNVYRHIVLGLHSSGRYGAVGLSRREDLMYKPLKYTVTSCFLPVIC